MHEYVGPHSHVALRLPSGTLKIVELIPNTIVSIGKYGTFGANLLLGRPYYLTFEILEKGGSFEHDELRIVSAAELHAELTEDNEASRSQTGYSGTSSAADVGGKSYAGADEAGCIMPSNRMTVDDPLKQALSMEQIEELKKAGTASGREIIAKIKQSHSALDEKTVFSLFKYTLRKSRKYLRRFTVLPVDVSRLALWMLLEKDPVKTMELREEVLGLMASWANVHFGGHSGECSSDGSFAKVRGGRWLVVDETGGLVVASLAERMGILHADKLACERSQDEEETDLGTFNVETSPDQDLMFPIKDRPSPLIVEAPRLSSLHGYREDQQIYLQPNSTSSQTRSRPPSATNTITLLHHAAQPNVSLLSYFSYATPSSSLSRVGEHPLNSRLKTLSFLSLIEPDLDPSYTEPPVIPTSTLSTLKSGKRGAYFRKRRRWEMTKETVDETRAGGFDGLVVCSFMRPASVLRHTLGLVKGGGQIVVYSPTVEPLLELMDYSSSARKTAFVTWRNGQAAGHTDDRNGMSFEGKNYTHRASSLDQQENDFPFDPTLLLGQTLQTARSREWQVLEGRTHPLMTARGGAEGYLFTATKVVPSQGKIEPKGRFAKKKKLDPFDGRLLGVL